MQVGQRYGGVDGLRGLLALLVIFHHFSIWIQIVGGAAWQPPQMNLLNQFGKGTVGLFFMITGLVFYPRVLDGFSQVDWSTLYIRRVFRIVPLVTFSVACVLAVILSTGTARLSLHDPINVAIWISTLYEPDLLGFFGTKRINAQVLWSLRFEWIFYFLLLPILAFVRDVIRYRLPTWTLPAALMALGGVLSILNYQFSYLSLFAFGMIAYEVRERTALAAWFSQSMATAVGAIAIAVALWLTPNPYSVSMPAFGFFLICVACGNTFGHVLDNRAVRVLGECSFSIYVLHGIVLYIAFAVLGGAKLPAEYASWLIVPIVGAVVLITAGTYLGIEVPLNRFGKVVAEHLTHRRIRRSSSMETEVAP